jgi:hypothetical protein
VQGAGSDGPRSDDAGAAAHAPREAGEPEPGVRAGGRGVTAATITAPPAAPARVPAGPAWRRLARSAWRRLARPAGRALASGPPARHLALLACYTAVGIAVTWPRATWLADGKLEATRDAGVYVWDFWWMAHAVEHLSNPWFTRSIVAPAGVQLGYHALMPLEGAAMLPVTLLFGPSASYNLLSILMPGLMCYAAYRAARLWLPTQTGAVFAGAFFGLSSIMAWHAWYQLNLAAGAVFPPLALEAAVRLRRSEGGRGGGRGKQAVVLGVVVGASLLTDQQSFVLVLIVVLAALVPWLASPAWRQRLAAAATAAVVDWLRRRAALALIPVLVLAALEAGGRATSRSAPCPPPCLPWTGRSPPTTRGRSWWACRSACGAGCRWPGRAARSTPRRRCWRPPTATRARSATCPACPSPR